MKALTLHQPWATLVAEGHKKIETRSWRPPKTLDVFAIHAAKTLNPEAVERFQNVIRREQWPLGAVVCVVRLIDWYQVDRRKGGLTCEKVGPAPGWTQRESAYGDYTHGGSWGGRRARF